MRVVGEAIEPSKRRKRGRPPRDIQTILEAAVIVFAREGYSAATIEMIATQATASTATLYKRFTNKHGLFIAALEHTSIQAIEIHTKNRVIVDHPFGGIMNRLEAHALVCSNHQVRGIMRAWISEVRCDNDVAALFAAKSGEDMVAGLVNHLRKLTDAGLIEFQTSPNETRIIAAQLMLGIVERFTLMRGLVLGDEVPALFAIGAIAEKAVHALIGIWGTPLGIREFGKISTHSAPITLNCGEVD